VNRFAAPAALVPPVAETRTFTVPVPAGATAAISVALRTTNEVAAVAPKITAVAPVKLVPVRVMLVPPLPGPDVGAICVTVGAAT
jgi:hypothetical protein